MQGFELTYKNKTLFVGITKGVAVIYISHLNHLNTDSRIYISGTDYQTRKRIIWLNEKIELGDEFQIRFTEVQSTSEPVETSDMDKNDPPQPSKLEQYYALKQSLTERGVL